eukprot:GAFH01002863.1.p6 GENE.GAFH01002863.1~~GAFH01002863.1.p6  ORF type:complete len:63 (-),score=4.11 GAFH01002863.1:411-599(-)
MIGAPQQRFARVIGGGGEGVLTALCSKIVKREEIVPGRDRRRRDGKSDATLLNKRAFEGVLG